MTTSAFIAYPSTPPEIDRTITAAVSLLRDRFGIREVKAWKESGVAGQFIGTHILEDIATHDALVADISQLNFNVTYEIGFAIARSRRLLLIRQTPIASPASELTELGIFDTIGYRHYENSEQLAELLSRVSDLEPLQVSMLKPNTAAPIYLVEARHRTDAVTRIVARVKKARLFYRSFDPSEQPRLSAFEAIQQVSQSYGVLLHLLPSHVQDARLHNLRVAFLAGLAAGMGKVLLLLQDGGEPVPIDYRDLVFPFEFPQQIDEAIADFATKVTEAWQSRPEQPFAVPRSFLETLTFGSSAAENEFRSLGDYYLEVDAFQRAVRGEARIVIGRKGSGKSALFFQVRDRIRGRRGNVVLDLKPDGYKLLKFKEVVLDLLETGTAEHTLVAFWEYLLWLEICHKLLQTDEVRHTRDSRLYSGYRTLAASYQSDQYVAEGDFSERISTLLQRIRDDFSVLVSPGESRLTHAKVTELLYRHDVGRLRSDVIAYLRFKDGLWLLFDNIDKGWPTHGIRREDLVIIKSLLDASRKIEQELSHHDMDARTLVFLRNDIFELLLEETSDRGKEAKVSVDWTDADLLRELLRRRIVFNGLSAVLLFADVWPQICVSHIHGEETSQFLIDRCLMRPRALLNLVNHCRSCAVNLSHAKIEPEDVVKGVSLYSTDLISEIGLEIRDVLPEAEDVLYAFIDARSRLTEEELERALASLGLTGGQTAHVVDLLLWYGVLGAVTLDGEIQYVYSVNYDMRVLKARLRTSKARPVYAINPAFWPGLGIRS